MALLKRRAKNTETATVAKKPIRHSGNRTGRYVSPTESGRVTPRTPKSNLASPRWFGRTIIGLLVGGVVVIALNYLHALPGAASAWYLVAGLGFIFAGFYMATRYK